MTRAAMTKLLILVILAFIICLPEFFTLYRVSKVNFLCLPYRPCEHGHQVKKIGAAEIRRKNTCDPPQTPRGVKWEQDCTQESQNDMTDPESDSGGGEDAEKSWFMCETDMDMAELHRNMSSSALKVHFEVSVALQLGDAETLNLTFYGGSNHSTLYLQPPEEEEEEEDDEGQRKAFYCCLPVMPASDTANQSRCLLWLANQTVLTVTAKGGLPWKRTQKDEWRCVFRVLWLALLCLVMLTIVSTVLGQIYWNRRSHKNLNVRPLGYDVTGQQLNGMIPHSYGSRPRTGLSPILEVDVQDNEETLLNGNVDHCTDYTANLHHRLHPFTSSLTEEHSC